MHKQTLFAHQNYQATTTATAIVVCLAATTEEEEEAYIYIAKTTLRKLKRNG